MTRREHAITPGLIRRVNRKLVPLMAKRNIPVKLERPIISISFDDFPQSVMENALPQLDEYDWKATFYVAAGLEGKTNHLGRHFDAEDIQTLVKDGHEIGCHTYNHVNILEVSNEAIQKEIEDNAHALGKIGVPPLKSFAYPYGEANAAQKRHLETGFTAMRGIVPGIHYDTVDLNQINAMKIYSGPDIDKVVRAIESLKERPGWLTLFTHDVRDNPSKFGCTPEDFSRVLKAIKQSGAEVVPIHQTIDLLRKKGKITGGLDQRNKVMMDKSISIIMPTYKRPKGLELALSSLVKQTVDTSDFQIIISDNDPAGSAKPYIDSMIALHKDINITYVHAVKPGVCNARNAAMEKVNGRFLLFIDDDMEAPPDWTQNMIDLLEKYKAGIAFSDVTARMHDKTDPKIQAMIPLFSRTLKEPEGFIDRFLGMGGAALDTAQMTFPNPPFDPALNDIGGEDDVLFHQLREQGVKTVWSPHFSAYEDIPASRATFQYIWKRNFAFGQGPTQLAADRGFKGIFKVIYWMLVGCAQIGVYGFKYGLERLQGKDIAVHSYARLSQAFGKIFWWDGFRPRLYGANSTTEMVKNSAS